MTRLAAVTPPTGPVPIPYPNLALTTSRPTARVGGRKLLDCEGYAHLGTSLF